MLDFSQPTRLIPTATGFTPLHLLRPFFFTLRDKKRLSDLHVPFLEILKPRTADYSTNITVAPWDSATPESRRAFRASLVQNLFGWDDLLSLRMRLSLADFAWVRLLSWDTTRSSNLITSNRLIRNTLIMRNGKTNAATSPNYF